MRKFLYSPGYGAGWSTWIGDNREQTEFALFYEPLIYAIESDYEGFDDALVQFKRDYKEKFDTEPYVGGADDLRVGYVGDDEAFRVDEYDGNESFDTKDSYEWF